jgi:hypothetical protein
MRSLQRCLSLVAFAGVLAVGGAPAEAGAPALSEKHRDPAHKFSLSYFKGWEPVPVEVGEKYLVCKLADAKSKGSARGTFDASIDVYRLAKGDKAKADVTPSEVPSGIPPEILERLGDGAPKDAFDLCVRNLMVADTVKWPKSTFKAIESKDKVPGKLWIMQVPSFYSESEGERGDMVLVVATFEKDQVEYAVRMFCGQPMRKTYEKPFVQIAKSFMYFDDKAEDVRSLDVLDGVNITPRRRRDIERSMVKGWDVIVSPKKQYIVVYNTKNNTNNALAKLIAERIERIREQIYEVQFPPSEPITAVSICRVCKDANEYREYGGPGGSAGYWSSGTEELVFYDASAAKKADADTLAVLYHEAFHQYIYYSVGEVAPHSWFNEGHGDYYAGAKYVNGKFKIGPFAWRVGTVRGAIVEGPRPRAEIKDEKTGEVNVEWGNKGYTPLQHLVAFSQGEYYSYPGVSYAQGWALIYFLREVVPANKKYNEKWGKILEVYFNALKEGVKRKAPPKEDLEPLPDDADEGGDEDGDDSKGDEPKGDDAPDKPPKPTTPPNGPGGEGGPDAPPGTPPDAPPEGFDVPQFFGRGDPKALEKALAAAFKDIDWAEFEAAWIKATK